MLLTYVYLNQALSGENVSSLSCQNDSIECYVVDNNGFVVISEDLNNIGKDAKGIVYC